MAITWQGQANLKVKIEEIEDKLVGEDLLTQQRARLLAEKDKLYEQLYPPEAKK